MSSITNLEKTRARASAPVVPGQWHAGFASVKAYAGVNAVPLLGVWVENTCGRSNAFCGYLLSAQFKAWQKTCGVALWCGFHSDRGEDGFEGKGFKWTRKDTLKDFPFVRLYWKAGKVDVCMSGEDWGSSGTAVVKKLKAYLKNYRPAPAPEPVPVTGIIALPCTASALETALHNTCDSGKWDGTVKYDGGKLVLEAKP